MHFSGNLCNGKGLTILSFAFTFHILIYAASAEALYAPGVTECRTGRDLAAAFADISFNTAIILIDIALDDEDWSYVQLPVPLARNFTVTSAHQGAWPTLDVNFLKGKLQLLGGAILRLDQVALMNTRRRPLNVSPGVDLLLPSPAPGPLIILQQSLLVLRNCYPPGFTQDNFSGLPRPMPGKQLINYSVPQTCCSNDTGLPLEQRCWPNRGLYVDVALEAKDMTADDLRLPANYTIIMLNTTVVCQTILSMECLAKYGPGGCILQSVSTSLPPPLLGYDNKTSSSGDDGSQPCAAAARKEAPVLPVALACSMGGVALIAAVSASIWALRRRERRAPAMAAYWAGTTAAGGLGSESPPNSSTSTTAALRGASDNRLSSKLASSAQSIAVVFGRSSAAAGQPQESPSATKLSQDAASAAAATPPDGAARPATGVMALVSPWTPQRPDICMGIQCGNEVRLASILLGKGGFGRVVVGSYDGKAVAVKLIGDGIGLAALPHDVKLLQGLAHEVAVLGRCQHPNVVRLLAANLGPPQPCLVMELMETSLERLLYEEPGKLLPLSTALHIALDIARGLEYLHPTILHRDLKPANVLLNDPRSDRPVAKLADFGLSRLLISVLVTQNPEAGTPPYMAPECFDHLTELTHKADIYSLGVLIAEMVSGQRPWRRMGMVQLACQVALMRKRPTVLNNLPPSRCPRKLYQLVQDCWDHDPQRRPAAAEVVKCLLLVQQQLAATPGSNSFEVDGCLVSHG